MDINKKIKISKKISLNITMKQIFMIVTVIMSLIALISVFSVVMSFVKLGDIEIKGIYDYDRMDILAAIDVSKDDFFGYIDTDKVEDSLRQDLKYLKSVKVTKKFPNTLVIHLESKSARWYIDFSKNGIVGSKYALDSDLVVIDRITGTDGVTELVLPDVSEVMSGRVPVFGKSETTVKKTLEIIDIVRGSSLRSRITKLDVHDRTDIRMIIDGKYDVRLGSATNLAGKLLKIEATLNEEKVKNSSGGELNVFDDLDREVQWYERIPSG